MHLFSVSALLIASSALVSAQKCPDFGIRECTAPEILALETNNCTDYHIFVARGSDSAYPGHQGDLIRLTCDGIDGSCNYENIIYPANSSWSGDGVWCPSAEKGVKNGQDQMKSYAERCPESKLILFGYSQGASVVLDILGGGGGAIYDCVQEESSSLDSSSSPGSQGKFISPCFTRLAFLVSIVLAIAAFGAPRRTADQSYSKGAGKDFNGTASRTSEQLAGLVPYKDILREYCNHGDPICSPDSEPMAVENHWSYFEKFQDEVSDWVVGLSQKQNEDNGKNSTKTSSTASSTVSSTTKPTADTTAPGDIQNDAAETTNPDATGIGHAVIWSPLMGLACAVCSIVLSTVLI